jgi:nitrogen fixation/metabolism regulation signal transduction histidine kinase
MISRKLYFQIVFRVILLVLVAVAIGWAVATNGSLVFVIACLFLEIILVNNLIRYLNTVNRKLSLFLESVQNNDSSLFFPDDLKGQPIQELYSGLNKVNKQIQRLKIDNQQREQYFQTLLEHVATGILTFDSRGFIIHANSAAKKLMSLNVLTHIAQIERINQDLFRAVKNIKPFEQRLVTVITKQGSVELSLKATSFKIKNDELTLLSIQDIRNELDQKELDSWMKLIRVLMHEIMNSVAPITSLSESLSSFFVKEGRPVFAEELDELTILKTIRGLNVIREQGSGLMQFVESFRKLTRLPNPEKKLFNVLDLLNRIRILYPSLENSNHVQLSVSVNPSDLKLFADENQISQVLINLVKNALESINSESEGQIHIKAQNTSKNGTEISITDNGPGIPAEMIEQIFVPFFTTRTNGSGIGLSLSRQIMRLHGGTLQVKSIPNKETSFWMTF